MVRYCKIHFLISFLLHFFFSEREKYWIMLKQKVETSLGQRQSLILMRKYLYLFILIFLFLFLLRFCFSHDDIVGLASSELQFRQSLTKGSYFQKGITKIVRFCSSFSFIDSMLTTTSRGYDRRHHKIPLPKRRKCNCLDLLARKRCI